MKKRKKYKKAYFKISNKIKNKIKDLHFKTSYLLCKKFDIIKIGKFSTKKVISNKKNLNK